MMCRIVLKVLLLSILFSGFGGIGLVAADDNLEQLERIRSRIEKAQEDLKNKRQSELDITRELALIKRNLERIDDRIGALQKQQQQLQTKSREQKETIAQSQSVVRESRRRLEKRLVALYKEGDSGPLKILFSANSPTEMVQQYHYLTRILKRDIVLLDEYRAAVAREKQQLQAYQALEEEKDRLLERERQQRQVASEARQLQARLLDDARADKNRLNRELAGLKEKEKRLKKLLDEIELEPRPSVPRDSGPVADNFAVGRGKLGWPVEGRVIIGFGTQKDNKLGTYYESNGIEIAAPPGRPIRAVASGTIVFADYFKGYGNLFILSHPGGYHTLYAQTDRMQKKLGEQVAAGDLLGYSGLGGRESMYFEIRSKGSPINPLGWLKKR